MNLRTRTDRSRRVWRVRVFVLLLLLLAYVSLYVATTTRSLGTPYLDWYAHRSFHSKAHFYAFLPLFMVERSLTRRFSEYSLNWRITKPVEIDQQIVE